MSCTGPSATTEPRSDVCEFRASAAADTVTVSWTALSCRETSTLTVWPTGNVISWMARARKAGLLDIERVSRRSQRWKPVVPGGVRFDPLDGDAGLVPRERHLRSRYDRPGGIRDLSRQSCSGTLPLPVDRGGAATRSHRQRSQSLPS